MHISYWCPFLGDVATISSVKNSIKSIRKFSKKKIKIDLINYFDEWFLLKEFFSSKYNLNLIDFYNYNLLKFLPKNGFIKSRVTFLAMFFLAIFPLHNYLKNKKPDFFIVHLLTSLPLILLLLFNFKSKFILRVSGLPKINFLRKYLWGIAGKKLFKITVPTIDTKKMLLDLNIFPEDKIIILRDPIFSIYEILQKKKEKINSNYKNFFVAIGRLTTQKNHQILLKAFSELIKEKDCTSNLLILGSGEKETELNSMIRNYNLDNKVFLVGYKKNPYKYINNSRCVISTSLWEDPGFVMVEAAACRKIIISSNCPNGPVEFIENGKAGYLFNNNDYRDLLLKIKLFLGENKNVIRQKKLTALKKARQYSLFYHYKELIKILNI